MSKEGYLVKKGHIRQNWRTRWFVLRDDTLSYFKKREDYNPAGVIHLQGSSLVCPPPGGNKKHPYILHLKTSAGKLYDINAPDLQTRDDWYRSIADRIRTLADTREGSPLLSSPTQGGKSSSIQLMCGNWELIRAMQDPWGGIPMSDLKIKSSVQNPCFTGQAVVEWLLKWSFVSTREDAVKLGTMLIYEGHIKMMDSVSVERLNAISFVQDKQKLKLLDSPDQCYLFAFYAPSKELDLFSDNLFDADKEMSVQEETPVQPPPSGDAQVVIKQGFLQKKVDGKADWKPRKFVLLKDVDQFLYYKGSKEGSPAGSIPLRGCSVLLPREHSSDSSSDSEDKESSNKPDHCNDYVDVMQTCLTLLTKKGHFYYLKAATREERNVWVTTLRQFIIGLSSFNNEL